MKGGTKMARSFRFNDQVELRERLDFSRQLSRGWAVQLSRGCSGDSYPRVLDYEMQIEDPCAKSVGAAQPKLG